MHLIIFVVESPIPNLVNANFFFIDVVGLSDPNLSTTTQFKKLQALHQCLKDCDIFKDANKEEILQFPTGDGMCIGFLQGIDKPLLLAIQIQENIAKYNRGKIPSEVIRTRIGIHSGNCFSYSNTQGQKNVWGPGIIIAKRIMDLGEDDHILLSNRVAEDIREISDQFRQIVKPVHDYTLKHGITMLVYSAYGLNFGNPKPPTQNQSQTSKMKDELERLQNSVFYTSLEVNLTLKNTEKMLVKHERTYEIENISDEPIKYVLHGIATDVPKETINELKVKVYDNSGAEMKISSVNFDKPYCKEFSTVFSEPVKKGEPGRMYILEYEVEEPEQFYENAFQVDCGRFTISFSFNENFSIKNPTLFHVNQETEEKTESKITPFVSKENEIVTKKWEINKASKGQTFRVEW